MRFNLTRELSLLFVVCVALAIVVGAAKESAATDAPETDQPEQRTGFALPKLFDFASFKRLFNKEYNSPVAELASEKMFLARAYRAFISAVKYRWNMASSWLAINHFSDRTPESLEKLNTRRGQLWSFRRDEPVEKSLSEPSDTRQLPVASREDIERELAQAEIDKDKPGFKEIADELAAEKSLRRRKRDATSNPAKRQLSLSDLVHAPASHGPGEISGRIPSNNPDYQPPELFSQAAAGAEGEQDETLEQEEASFISKLPGAGFIKSITGELTRRLAAPPLVVSPTSGRNDEVEQQVEKVGKLRANDKLIIDHRRSGCFFRVRNQGRCGSCFIFSTTALYEWMHCRDTGKLVAFSEQYPIDCGERIGINGCKGGEERDVGMFVREFGLELRDNYPYNQRVNECPYDPDEDPKVMGYLKVRNEFGMHTVSFRLLEKTLEQSPILLGFGSYTGFAEYGGGVDKPDGKCDYNRGHAMLLVGMGVQDGQEYWLFRNSYNTDWGENGYYKLSKDSDCLMDGYGWTSKGNFKWKDSITANPHYKAFN